VMHVVIGTAGSAGDAGSCISATREGRHDFLVEKSCGLKVACAIQLPAFPAFPAPVVTSYALLSPGTLLPNGGQIRTRPSRRSGWGRGFDALTLTLVRPIPLCVHLTGYTVPTQVRTFR
jgi:hypothetical protein